MLFQVCGNTPWTFCVPACWRAQIHYGHSCLVPIDMTTIPTMYVFVEIAIDVAHLVDSILLNFPPSAPDPVALSSASSEDACVPVTDTAASTGGAGTSDSFKQSISDADRPLTTFYPRLVLAGTIQFTSAVQATKTALLATHRYTEVLVPQEKPLSGGEVLGCTAPRFGHHANRPDAIIFIADGRFHLESIMIRNPEIPAFKYDPYSKKFTIETYDTAAMHQIRHDAIDKARVARKFGLILGTLGRQGSPHIMQALEELLRARGLPFLSICLSEISPAKLALFADVDAYVCPRVVV